MNIDQTDIANLSDNDVKLMVIALTDGTVNHPESPVVDFWRRAAIALIRAHRERKAVFAALAMDAMSGDDECGAIVEPGDDPVADGLEELRQAIRRERGLD